MAGPERFGGADDHLDLELLDMHGSRFGWMKLRRPLQEAGGRLSPLPFVAVQSWI